MPARAYDPALMADKIVSLVPSEPGWRALYRADEDWEEPELTRIVAWALVEDADGDRRVVGMVVDAADQTQVVPAPDGGSPVSPLFDRYGFKD